MLINLFDFYETLGFKSFFFLNSLNLSKRWPTTDISEGLHPSLFCSEKGKVSLFLIEAFLRWLKKQNLSRTSFLSTFTIRMKQSRQGFFLLQHVCPPSHLPPYLSLQTPSSYYSKIETNCDWTYRLVVVTFSTVLQLAILSYKAFF